MAIDLEKVQYTDGETVIYAKNLNEIQDAILDLDRRTDVVGDSILSAIAPLEATYTASRAYTIGSYLFVGTRFFKVTQAIAEGGTITPGTNAVQTTVAEQLMALAAKPAILG